MEDIVKKKIKEYVLDAVSDDYEDLATIIAEVRAWNEGNTDVDSPTILSALDQLIRDGYVQAYILSAEPVAGSVPTDFDPKYASELFFYVTAKGKQRVSSEETVL